MNQALVAKVAAKLVAGSLSGLFTKSEGSSPGIVRSAIDAWIWQAVGEGSPPPHEFVYVWEIKI